MHSRNTLYFKPLRFPGKSPKPTVWTVSQGPGGVGNQSQTMPSQTLQTTLLDHPQDPAKPPVWQGAGRCCGPAWAGRVGRGGRKGGRKPHFSRVLGTWESDVSGVPGKPRNFEVPGTSEFRGFRGTRKTWFPDTPSLAGFPKPGFGNPEN